MAASLCRMLSWRTFKNHKWMTPCCSEILATYNVKSFGSAVNIQRCQSSGLNTQQAVSPSEVYTKASENLSTFEAAIQHEDYFGLKNLVTLQDLFQARVHLGHNVGLRHESMSPYIYGTRQGVDIIDLEQTLPLLHDALNFCAHIVYRGGMILFLCRNMQFLPKVEQTAREVKEYSHCRPWLRGTFTNSANMFNSLPIYPELCIFLNTQDTVFETHRGVVEASKLLVPTIGIVDTNVDCANLIAYPIPGNDDSPASLQLFLDLFKTAIIRAKEKRKEDGIDETAS
ncbi:unnamed protein product [Lymnaea stagnalis]|uniref:Mitochondrial ribosomal protein S2 n=1 Tax=Lymnaea stagnalis TaxID=6523 RepID=A0AAV2I6F0_LYMST